MKPRFSFVREKAVPVARLFVGKSIFPREDRTVVTGEKAVT
jgi:hypothetical protein